MKNIFIDLDDVLNTFVPTYLKLLGCGDVDYKDIDPEWGYDIVGIANHLHPTPVWNSSDIWEFATQEFWATIPESKEAGQLLVDCIDEVGRDNVYILTKPVGYPDSAGPPCVAGKVQWINEFGMGRNYVLTAHKHLCAHDSLLIDDNEDNINSFIRAGGSGFLVPKPWNSAWRFR